MNIGGLLSLDGKTISKRTDLLTLDPTNNPLESCLITRNDFPKTITQHAIGIASGILGGCLICCQLLKKPEQVG
jgi:hypothetical protein